MFQKRNNPAASYGVFEPAPKKTGRGPGADGPGAARLAHGTPEKFIVGHGPLGLIIISNINLRLPCAQPRKKVVYKTMSIGGKL